MRVKNKIELVGDGLENPFNALAMLNAAAMFQTTCVFRDRMDLASNWSAEIGNEVVLPFIEQDGLDCYSPLIALDNLKNAQPVYGFQLPQQSKAALVAGNERLGLSSKVASSADHALVIPMISKKVTCINVAAASAVSLYYLSFGLKGKMQIRKEPQKRRPEIVFIGGSDHVELGSSIRSAAAFGWTRLFLEDRHNAWFGADRLQTSESRGAARRSKNSIRIVPADRDNRYFFAEAVVVTTEDKGEPLYQVDLARGENQVIVIPDESAGALNESLERIAPKIKYARIQVGDAAYRYHFRHFASIALAEVARQVGQKSLWTPSRQAQTYQSALKTLLEERGEEVFLDELAAY